NLLLATACAGLVSAGAVMAQVGAERNRHLLYIALPGGSGVDGQSGIVVLDADRNYQFVKRISYGLPAARMPGPEITGVTASVPENKLYVTTQGGNMLAIDLTTDQVAWE